jgi:hypothetical protein
MKRHESLVIYSTADIASRYRKRPDTGNLLAKVVISPIYTSAAGSR